jgi:dTDP-4-amino-4,6-dideoxygalactose transaminase
MSLHGYENRPKPFEVPIYVTQPLLPRLDKYMSMLETVWDSKQLSNNGPMVRQLEAELKNYLRVQNLSVFSNGTTALQLALKVLDLKGEVITTPFTFAATPHALYWNNLRPVFCDISEDTYTIDADKIEQLITPETTAILPVHVFGNPCDVQRIQEIADKHGLKVIYDAAHAFGVEINNKPIGTFGDISMFSLHATKIYHTVEGGALAFGDCSLKERADRLRNFGITGEDEIIGPGLNGKLNELQAIMGLLLIDLVKEEIENRKALTILYREHLKDIPGISCSKDIENVRHNYPYFVIKVDADEFGIDRDELQKELKKYNIYSRKYFYPLCSHIQCYSKHPSADAGNLPQSEKVSRQVLSLPLYGRLQKDDVEKICDIIRYVAKHHNVQ